MLRSLGIDPKLSMPSVAVIYGQGRCLGIPLTGSELSQSKIVQLASLCGRSCECDLDRKWLYGTQMIHHWGQQRQLKAEDNLDFDPAAALVVAEVSGILGRVGSGANRDANASLGNGLIIHDFSSEDDDETNLPINPSAAGAQTKSEQGKTSPGDGNEPPVVEPAQATKHQQPESSNQASTSESINVRWLLIIVIGVVVLLLAVVAVVRGKE